MANNHLVLLAGATGLVGGLALSGLLRRAEAEHFRVCAPTRRALKLTHPRLDNIVVDPANAAGMQQILQALSAKGMPVSSFICALGTTLRAAGSKDAFAAIDRDLVLALADIARQRGARQALLVSSVGANPRSSNFYLRIKGEVETGMVAAGFERVDILQPGLLLGERAGPPRAGERIAIHLAPIYNMLLAGPLRRYRAIDAKTVAAALIALNGAAGNGVARLTYSEIVGAASAASL